MFAQDRNAMRKVFFDAWKKYREKAVLDPMEDRLARIILMHPEYHALFDDEDNLLRDFPAAGGEGNPFLHLSLHLAVQEQLATRRPLEVADLYPELAGKYGDSHAAEHAIMECLQEMIWQAQQSQAMADEGLYLDCLRKRLAAAGNGN